MKEFMKERRKYWVCVSGRSKGEFSSQELKKNGRIQKMKNDS